MSTSIRETQGDVGDPAGTTPLVAADELLATADLQPEVQAGPDDIAFDIPGVDTLPEHDQTRIRNSFLRKHTELENERQRTKEAHEQYLRAIQVLQAQHPQAHQPAQQESLPYEERFKNLTPWQAVERLADERAEAKFGELMERAGLPQVKQNTDTIMRELQIIQAKQVYPEVLQYQDKLTAFSRVLADGLGEKAAAKISILEMMAMLKAREQLHAASNGRPKVQANGVPQARPRAPQAAVARPGVNSQAVEPDQRTKSFADAFQKAKAHLGIHGEFRDAVNIR